MDLKEKIENLIRPEIERLGYKFLRVEIKPRGRAKMLTVFIDETTTRQPPSRLRRAPGGLSVEDCARVSRTIDPILEKADLIESRYFLIVSSPGI